MATERDLARVLLDKAAGDEAAPRALTDDANVPDAILGFHAQQAAKKLFKAVLAHRGIAYEFRHDLDYLGELIESAGIEKPPAFESAVALTPWAVELRHEDPSEAPSLDREEALELINGIRGWAERLCVPGDNPSIAPNSPGQP